MQTQQGIIATAVPSHIVARGTAPKHTMQWYLQKCPGVTGQVARHINSTLKTEQPGIALATAIAFVGAIRSERIRSFDGISTNIYTCAIAPSGVGKSRATQCIADICEQSELGYLLMGRPGSDAGILKRLQKTNRQLLIWDEFGLAFSEMSQSKSSYRVAIISTIMDLYSSAGRVCLGKELKGEERVDVHRPFLSVCAASTPGRFYQALSKEFIEDGFLGRFMVFDTNDAISFKRPSFDKIPLQLIEEIQALNMGDPRMAGGDLEKLLRPECHALTMDETILSVIENLSETRITESRSEIERIFWSRSYENTIKLCMIFADNNGECSDVNAMFGWSLVAHLIEHLLERCTTDLHDTRNDKIQVDRTRKFEQIIKPGEEITQAQLAQRCQKLGLGRQERLARTSELVESEIWGMQERYISESSQRPTKFYFVLKS